MIYLLRSNFPTNFTLVTIQQLTGSSTDDTVAAPTCMHAAEIDEKRCKTAVGHHQRQNDSWGCHGYLSTHTHTTGKKLTLPLLLNAHTGRTQFSWNFFRCGGTYAHLQWNSDFMYHFSRVSYKQSNSNWGSESNKGLCPYCETLTKTLRAGNWYLIMCICWCCELDTISAQIIASAPIYQQYANYEYLMSSSVWRNCDIALCSTPVLNSGNLPSSSRNSLAETPGEKREGSRAVPRTGPPWHVLVSLQVSLRGSYESVKVGFRNSSYFVYNLPGWFV
jgi:hypothetical protein